MTISRVTTIIMFRFLEDRKDTFAGLGKSSTCACAIQMLECHFTLLVVDYEAVIRIRVGGWGRARAKHRRRARLYSRSDIKP